MTNHKNKSKNRIMTIVLLFIIIIVFGIIYNGQRADKLKINKCYAVGHVSKFESQFRGGAGYIYEFNAKGSKFTDRYSYSDNRAPFDNKNFIVVYECDNPKNNRLLIFEKDYKKYDEVFPDSMDWVTPYEE